MNDRQIYTLLTSLGAIPFVAGALLPIVEVTEVPLIGDVRVALEAYAVSIVVFLTGTHWAAQLHHPTNTPVNLFVVSNAVFLLALGFYLVAPWHVSVVAQAVALLALLWIDAKLHGSLLSDHYLRVRAAITTVACASLITAALIS